ncbi:MAG: hypothetical protein BWY68_00590 [bacterium ADurb.Bin400]|nr:MAG: hypothetical protein BWY68_00590 [bacterium ADurb.Bin400]
MEVDPYGFPSFTDNKVVGWGREGVSPIFSGHEGVMVGLISREE